MVQAYAPISMMAKNKSTVRFSASPSSRWYYPLRWAVLIVLGLVIYYQTFRFSFVFDDNYYLLNTFYIRSLGMISHIWSTLPKTRMIGIYSFALNYHIHQLHPSGYHVFNFLIHLLAAGMVWSVAALLFKVAGISTVKLRGGSQPVEWSRRELPFLIALIFLAHPCQTQAVTYISQRFESMATLFYLGSINFYVRARIASSKGLKTFLFICFVSSALLGALTKEVVATIPLMIVAVEFILLNRGPLNQGGPLPWRMYSGIAIAGAMFFFFFEKTVRTDVINLYFHYSAPSESHDGDVVNGGKYVLTQMRVFLTFLRLLIFPLHQNVDYDYPLSTGLLDPPLTLCGLGLMGLLVYLIFRLRRQWPLIAFGLAWILITFSVNMVPRVNVIFEHKLYLISFGFFLAAVCVLSNLIKDRRLLFGLLLALIAVLSLASYRRNQVWRNELTLWADTVKASPHKARPYNGLGVAFSEYGYPAQALPVFNKAIALNPGYAEAYNNRGNAYRQQSNYSKAISDFNKAIAMRPNYAQAYRNRAKIFDQQGHFDLALKDFDQAIALAPLNLDIYLERGLLWIKQGHSQEALKDIQEVLNVEPDNYDALINRAGVYFCTGLYDLAITDLDRAEDLAPSDYKVYKNRAFCFLALNRKDEALKDIEASLRLNPQDPALIAQYQQMMRLK